MKLQIRKLRFEDTKEVHDIEMKLFSDPWSEESFVTTSYNYQSFVLTDPEIDKIIGYLVGEKVIDEFIIYNLGIRKEFQSQGIGSYFVKKIIDKFQLEGCIKFILEVRMRNIAAQSLYKKLGFKNIYLRKNYYDNPVDDAIVMMLKLNKENE